MNGHEFLRLCLACGIAVAACGGARPNPSVTAEDLVCSEGEEPGATEASPEWTELPEGTVASVEIRGLRSVPDEVVRSAIESRPGAPASPETVRADARRILSLEAFEDVRVSASRGEGGAEIVFEVVERPLVRNAAVRGAEEEVPSVGRVRLISGEVYDPLRIDRAVARLVEDHRREGYLQARGEARARRIGRERVDVCLIVEPGPRYSLDNFEFVGNERVADEDLRSLVRTFHDRVNVEGGLYREDLLAEDLTLIYAHYYDRGMIGVRIEEPRVVWVEDDLLSVQVSIDEGPVFRVRRVTVSGDLLADAREYLERLGVRAGEVFSRERFVEGIGRLHELDRQLGRAEIFVDPVTDMDWDEGAVEIELVIRGPADPTPATGPSPPGGLDILEDELRLDEGGLRLDMEPP